MSALIAALIITEIAFMLLTGSVARQKGRSTADGIVPGLVFGLIVELCLPAKREEAATSIRADTHAPYSHTRSMRRQGQRDAEAIRPGFHPDDWTER